jgi:putative copper export protein
VYELVLVLHLLGAAVWTGGHLVLAISVVPRALKSRSTDPVVQFEHVFERVGIPALVVQVFTGLWLAQRLLPEPSDWFKFDNAASTMVAVKLVLLGITVALALDARLRLIPRLSERNLSALVWHIGAVAVISVLFVIAGVGVRTGGII